MHCAITFFLPEKVGEQLPRHQLRITTGVHERSQIIAGSHIEGELEEKRILGEAQSQYRKYVCGRKTQPN